MIHVQVSMWPQGDPSRAYPLGEAILVNDGTGTASKGNYDVCLSKRGGFAKGKWKEGHIEGFPRARLGVWDLLFRSLAILQSRNKGSSVDEVMQVGSKEESLTTDQADHEEETAAPSQPDPETDLLKKATVTVANLGFGEVVGEMFKMSLEDLLERHPRVCPGASKPSSKGPSHGP